MARPNRHNSLPCASYPVEVHCRKRAMVAVEINGHFNVPVCRDCAENCRRAGVMTSSWGDRDAVSFATRFVASYPNIPRRDYKGPDW